MRPAGKISMLAAITYVVTSTLVHAQAPASAPAPTESSGALTINAAPGPILVNLSFKKIHGTATLTINPDGSYLFSGSASDKKPNRDFSLAVALKSKAGILLFHYVGNAANGIQWSEQGQSTALKDDFAIFAGSHQESWSYTFPLSALGREKLYQEQKAKREKIRQEEEAARKRHDEAVAAQKKEELKKEEQREVQEQIAQAQQQQHGGGGSNVASDIESAASTVGSVVNSVGGVVSDIAAFF
jgi:Skp family chaperone for outer membrane proteins